LCAENQVKRKGEVFFARQNLTCNGLIDIVRSESNGAQR